ncbi:MAG: hypothetical protein E6Q37_08950 [Crocinitomicaceae bacterium]|nr:MAG: hypothetical protein E6Q37_08950 [Crocinitomicaceae bacterium]
MKKTLFLIGLISLLVASCKTYSEEEVQGFDKAIQKFVMKSGLNYEKSESGLYYLIEKEGEGEFIKFTDEVSFRYVGKLLDGKTFDGRYKRTPLTFEVSKLIEGWKEGFMYLKKGGKAKLIIPPTLGYGENQLPEIPANSILYFEVEVVDVK